MEERPRSHPWTTLAQALALPAAVALVVGVVTLVQRHEATDSTRAVTTPPAPTQLAIVATTPTSTPVATLAPPLPSPREMTAMAYDSVHDDVVMFGGGGFGTEPATADTWTLDIRGWHLQHPAHSPPPLGGVQIAEDPTHGALVLVGAFPATADADTATLETWVWDGRTWTRRQNVPAPRQALVGLAALAAEHQVVLVTYPAPISPKTEQLNTYTWNGTSWTLHHPATSLPIGGASPKLCSAPARHRVIALFSAQPDNGTETWMWDGQTWTRLITSGAPPYDPITATMAASPTTSDVVLYEGGDSGGQTWTLAGDTWHELDAHSPTIDTDYDGAELMADPRIGRVITIGGASRPNDLSTLWVLTASTWSAQPAIALGSPSG